MTATTTRKKQRATTTQNQKAPAQRTQKAPTGKNGGNRGKSERPATHRGYIRPSAQIHCLRAENPHRPGTIDHGKWEVITRVRTWQDARKAGIDAGYIRKAEARGQVRISQDDSLPGDRSEQITQAG
jgi:hypothetical protein